MVSEANGSTENSGEMNHETMDSQETNWGGCACDEHWVLCVTDDGEHYIKTNDEQYSG